jgi:uncharacterized protein YjbJ (UPF0337 family)
MGIVDRIWSYETPTSESIGNALSQRLRDLVGADAPGASQSDTQQPAGPGSMASASAAAPEAAATAPVGEKSQAAIPPPDPEKNRPREAAQSRDKAQNAAPSAALSDAPGRQFVERFQAAVGRADGNGEKNTGSKWQAPPEFHEIQRQFETDFRKRLDGALAEFERRVSSQALVDDVAGQVEERIRLAANGIFKEVKEQAWKMHSAVAGELRTFRDQFAREIEDRIAMLDRASQHAMQTQGKLEQTLPNAETALRSLLTSGQEASARLQEMSNQLEDRLRAFQQDVSRQIDSRKESLDGLAQSLRQEGLDLQGQMEKFRGEAAGAREALGHAADQSLEKLNAAAEETSARVREAREDLRRAADQSIEKLNAGADEAIARAGEAREALGRAADQSLEKLNAAADEVSVRARDEIEKVTAEIERRVLSGGLVEKATEQLGKATEEIVEPALDRIRNASQGADSAAESLAGASQRVAGQLDDARQRIEARLDSLLGEQLGQLETGMSEFQRKAGEELGGLVERVVEQSTSELDQRLQSLLQDLFASTSQRINTAARATLNNMQEGLKEAFEPQGSDSAPEPAAVEPVEHPVGE